MKIALVGYGRMGRTVEEVAEARGHEVVLRLDASDDLGLEVLRDESAPVVDVAIDFTVPDAVVESVRAVAGAGVDMVVGTTGWYDRLGQVREVVREAGTGLIWAPNFSLGVQAFFRMVRTAARLADGLPGWDAYLSEVHHRHKLDHPSGTARRLAEILLAELSEKRAWASGPGEGRIDPGILQVASVRAGENPGAHSVVLEGEHDRIELTHQARGREAFATGALEAAGWILGRRGVFTLDEMLDQRFESKGGESHG